jgi:3-oxoadipate enol-lactonase
MDCDMTSPSTGQKAYEVIDCAIPNAPWIAMVHGLSQDRRVFDRQVDAFTTDYRLILIDLPGHGRSSDILSPYGLSEYASHIQDCLKDAGINRCHFWGTHTGASAGLLLSCYEPGVFQTLILESPVFPGRPIPSVTSLFIKVSEIACTKGIAEAREVWWQEGAWFDVMRARPAECRAAEQRQIIDDFNGLPWLDGGLVSRRISPIDNALRQLRSPVLIVNGEYDLADFRAAADALDQLISPCYRATVEEAGGFPLWEFPDRTGEIVRRFLIETVAA